MARRAPPSAETRARISAAVRAHWADPDRRTEQGALTRRRMTRPGISAKISERTKAALADPAIRARRRQAVITAMASPEVRLRISLRTREAMRDPAVRQRISEGVKHAARLQSELTPLRKIWEGLSEEARRMALREIMTPQAQ